MKNAYWDDSPPFKFPKTGVSAFSLRSHCPDSPFHSSILHGGRKYHGTHCYSQPPFLSLAILLAFSLHTLYRAFEGQSELFTWAFPSSHHCSSWSLYFEKSSFHCSQANNHSSIASFSMQPPVTHPTVHSPRPTYLCHTLKETCTSGALQRNDEKLNIGYPREKRKKVSQSSFRLPRMGRGKA